MTQPKTMNLQGVLIRAGELRADGVIFTEEALQEMVKGNPGWKLYRCPDGVLCVLGIVKAPVMET